RPALPILEPTSAAAARIRIVIDDLIHLILGLELPPRTQVPGLPTRLTPLPLAARQLLGLRTRLRAPLSARLRLVHRRRLGARARVLTRLLLQPPQPIVVPLDPDREIENELNTRLTPRVINRLRLGAIHACKIRCINRESLPEAPTTERLHEDKHLQANHDRQVGRKTGVTPRVTRRIHTPKSDSHPLIFSGGSN